MKLFVLLLLLPYITNAANILVVLSSPYRSHNAWSNMLSNALAEKGHNITMLCLEISGEKVPNTHYLMLDKQKEFSDKDFHKVNYIHLIDVNVLEKLHAISQYYVPLAQAYLESTGYKQLLDYPDSFKFDLIICETVTSLVGFAGRFGDPPVVGVMSNREAQLVNIAIGGNIFSPSMYKSTIATLPFSSFWGRFQNYFFTILFELVFTNIPHKKPQIYLINKHPAFDESEPLMQNVIPVGGLHIRATRKLPEDLKGILDSSTNGTILFSLGTIVQSAMLSSEYMEEIVETFRTLPQYTFLWKYENTSLPFDVPFNVIIRKWLPQNDILAHPNLKLFINHGGLLSIQESVWNGVPMISIPFFFDHFGNSEYAVKMGYAEQEDIRKIKRNSFKKLIQRVMMDPKYRENAKIFSQMFKDQKESPMERAIWWTEFVMRHPNKNFMASPYANINFFIRHSWDIVTFIVLLVLLSIYLFFKMIHILFKFLKQAYKTYKYLTRKLKVE